MSAVDLSKVPANITKIAFTVTIYEPEQRKQNFGQVNNAFIRIYNEENGEEMLYLPAGTLLHPNRSPRLYQTH